jgi:hypothetical protein
MAILDAKLPAHQATTKAISPTKVEALTLEGKAPLVIDGGALGTVRTLLKNQALPAQNGLWEVSKNEVLAGTGKLGGEGKIGVGEGWTLVRPSDADSPGDVTEGMLVPVEDGETNQQTSWIQRTPGPIEVGTTAQTFEALTAGARGVAGGDLVGTYSKPSIAEAVIDAGNMAEGAILRPSFGAGVRDYGIVSTLPTAPAPSLGDVCRYKAAVGVYWNLLYTGESGLPWAVIGATPLFAEVAKEETTASKTFADLETKGPSITVPLKGDYDVEIGARVFDNTAYAFMSYAIGATAATEADQYGPVAGFETSTTIGVQGSRPRRKEGIAASTAIVAKYSVEGGTAFYSRRWLRVTPVRVG